MWKNYSVNYFRNNKGMMVFLMAVAFFAASLLSFISSFFYNLWADYVHQSYLKTGAASVDITTSVIIYTFIMTLAVLSLILMIHNTFGVSMSARIHQLGVLKSVGATPRQLKSALVQETLGVCLLPVLLGNIFGTVLCYGIVLIVIEAGKTVRTYELEYKFSPYIFLISFGVSVFALGVSAWIPARKISRISVLDAVFNREDNMPSKMKKFRLSSALFGIEGELAGRSLYARRKSLRVSRMALFLAVTAFFAFLNIERISALSVQETYWDRYADVWDYMITAKGNIGEKVSLLENVRKMEDVESCILYEKAAMYTLLDRKDFSREFLELGGPEEFSEEISCLENGKYLVKVSVIVMDDESFIQYLGKCGLESALIYDKGAVILNRIRDKQSSSPGNRIYIPFLSTAEGTAIDLSVGMEGEKAVKAKVTALTDRVPQLREGFEDVSLVTLMSESYYQSLRKPFLSGECFFTVRIKIMESEGENTKIKNNLEKLLGEEEILESRVEKQNSDKIIRSGLRLIGGIAATVLACTGLSNVFSLTMGQIRQRKKEFARYLSIGLSPRGLKKILYLEALRIGGNPILLALFVNIPLVLFALNACGIGISNFLQNMPLCPILIFSFGIVFIVYLTYYIVGKQILNGDLIAALNDERIFE